jgi:protein gp37
MSTKIEWTDETWNPVSGCSKVSEDLLMEPLRWRQPRKIVVNSMSDLFHEQVPDEFIRMVFAVMGEASHHTFQVLTNRPARMQRLMTEWLNEGDFATLTGATEPSFPWPNVWVGVSVENQDAANERIPFLLETPAAGRFISCESLLGPVDLTRIDLGDQLTKGYGKRRILWNALTGWESQYASGESPDSANHPKCMVNLGSRINWVIVGGESGPGARPMHPDWVRSIRDQCQEAGVQFYMKQRDCME